VAQFEFLGGLREHFPPYFAVKLSFLSSNSRHFNRKVRQENRRVRGENQIDHYHPAKSCNFSGVGLLLRQIAENRQLVRLAPVRFDCEKYQRDASGR